MNALLLCALRMIDCGACRWLATLVGTLCCQWVCTLPYCMLPVACA